MTPEELTFARGFVLAVWDEFRYATSVPEAPHFYLVRDRVRLELQVDFDRFVALVAERGYLGSFRGQRWRYLDIDAGHPRRYRYWVSPNLFGPGLNLNRAAIDGREQEQLGLDLGAV